MKTHHRHLYSDVVIWVVIGISIIVIVAALSGWDPTFGLIAHAWRHPFVITATVSIALACWLARALQQRDNAENASFRKHIATGVYLAVAVCLLSLGLTLVFRPYIT